MDTSLATVYEYVARRLPDALAISVPGRDLTYAEFEDRAARLASALEAAGVGAGDAVACYLYNEAAYLETVFAALKLGAVPVNVNYRYTGPELGSLLADAGASAIVFSGSLAARLGQAVREVPSLRLLVRAGLRRRTGMRRRPESTRYPRRGQPPPRPSPESGAPFPTMAPRPQPHR